MENDKLKTLEKHIDAVIELLKGLSYDEIHEILREASHKARKQSILISNSLNP